MLVPPRTIQHIMQGYSIEGSPPMWLMRQAGRYLPEYRAIRAHFPDFMTFCQTKDVLVEVTLQPLRRWSFDAAIIFSDILILPHVMGQYVNFLPNHGPQLAPPCWGDFLQHKLEKSHVLPTLEAIADVKKAIPSTCTLFGFAGAPWTLLRYMFTGSRSTDSSQLAEWGGTAEGQKVLKHLEDTIVNWLTWQLEAGCDVVQLFDSWAADVLPSHRDFWLWGPAQRIIDRLPANTVLYFGKGVEIEALGLKNCALGLGPDVNPVHFPSKRVVQGNLSPELLMAGSFDDPVQRLIEGMSGRPYIFNLGHGILPGTPLQHVDRLVELVTCK